MTEPTTEHLIELAQSGDENALAELFERYRERLRRMVLLRLDARVRGRFDASDVVQDAFVEVARRLPSYAEDPNVPLFLWMRMVTGDRLAQLHRMHLRTEKRAAGREAPPGVGNVPEASSVYLASQLAGQFTSVDRGLIQEEVRAKLAAALGAMEQHDREVIAMRHFEEMSTSEIALSLEMTRSGVLKRYTRAIRRLSEAINVTSDISIK